MEAGAPRRQERCSASGSSLRLLQKNQVCLVRIESLRTNPTKCDDTNRSHLCMNRLSHRQRLGHPQESRNGSSNLPTRELRQATCGGWKTHGGREVTGRLNIATTAFSSAKSRTQSARFRKAVESIVRLPACQRVIGGEESRSSSRHTVGHQ